MFALFCISLAFTEEMPPSHTERGSIIPDSVHLSLLRKNITIGKCDAVLGGLSSTGAAADCTSLTECITSMPTAETCPTLTLTLLPGVFDGNENNNIQVGSKTGTCSSDLNCDVASLVLIGPGNPDSSNTSELKCNTTPRIVTHLNPTGKPCPLGCALWSDMAGDGCTRYQSAVNSKFASGVPPTSWCCAQPASDPAEIPYCYCRGSGDASVLRCDSNSTKDPHAVIKGDSQKIFYVTAKGSLTLANLSFYQGGSSC